MMNTAFDADEVLSNLPKKMSRIAARAAALYEFDGISVNKATNFDKVTAAMKHKRFICWACDTISDKCGFTTRVGVVLAALYTFIDAETPATKFWKEVQDGSNPDPESGSRALQRALLEHSVDAGSGSRSGKKSLKWDRMAELCLSAWESWKSGRKVKLLRLTPAGLEKYTSHLKNKASGVL